MIGLEFETEFVHPANIQIPDGVNYTHDASIENPIVKVGGMRIFDRTGQYTIGTEFVFSPVYPSKLDILKDRLDYLIQSLIENGEEEKSCRAGIHIHISPSMLSSWDIESIKNLLGAALVYEPVFFYIGEFGYQHRGLKNDFTYCRSYNENSIPVIRWNEGNYRVFEIDDLFRVKSVSGFFKMMGVMVGDVRRYTPARYMWFNLVSILLHNTVEFRTFNKTFNSELIVGAADLCQKFVDTFINKEVKSDFEMNTVFDTSKEDTIKLFDEMAEKINLDYYRRKIIRKCIEISPEIKAVPRPTYTHLQRYVLFPSQYRTWVEVENVEEPAFEDIHTITGR